MNHVFCFVSSAKTENFSRLALYSFFKETKLETGDIFVFVNNDGTNAFKEEYPIPRPLSYESDFKINSIFGVVVPIPGVPAKNVLIPTIVRYESNCDLFLYIQCGISPYAYGLPFHSSGSISGEW